MAEGVASIDTYVAATMALTPYEAKESNVELVAKLGLATVGTAYAVKVSGASHPSEATSEAMMCIHGLNG